MAKRLKDYNSSGINYVSYLFTLILLMLYTVLSFALINLGLNKVHPVSYHISGNISMFDFIYYSFKTFTLGSIDYINPIDKWSKILQMAESLNFIIYSVIIVGLFFSTKSQKYSYELNSLISKIQRDGGSMQSLIAEEYNLESIEDAISALKKVKAGMLNFIFWISNGI